ncbi:molybdenum cofactor guanylyltransferase MobA [Nitratireductor soli]|uniref:molybdenum cofactor guanylyltransferase MobA n=1 Tax=Nitratireductor soli TaxID=1670619 RepID=UPI00065E2661|nr:molybdenum cofactor guanylyltransferase MobA [Nitratireductor soli]
MVTTIAGVILAGGEATRLGGGDKGLASIGDATLLELVAARLAPQVTHVVLNANGDPHRFASFGLEVIADPLPERLGPLGGILAGLRWAARQESLTHIVTVAADTPFFPADLVTRLGVAVVDAQDIALARSMGRVHPVFGLWPTALADDLAAHIAEGGKRRVTAYAGERRRVALVDFAADGEIDPFFNINTPGDLAKARTMVRREKE